MKLWVSCSILYVHIVLTGIYSTGCQCFVGWEGTDCDKDVDECANYTLCTEPNMECVNIPGNYSCRCKSGFSLNETTGNCESKFSLFVLSSDENQNYVWYVI